MKSVLLSLLLLLPLEVLAEEPDDTDSPARIVSWCEGEKVIHAGRQEEPPYLLRDCGQLGLRCYRGQRQAGEILKFFAYCE